MLIKFLEASCFTWAKHFLSGALCVSVLFTNPDAVTRGWVRTHISEVWLSPLIANRMKSPASCWDRKGCICTLKFLGKTKEFPLFGQDTQSSLSFLTSFNSENSHLCFEIFQSIANILLKKKVLLKNPAFFPCADNSLNCWAVHGLKHQTSC